jgi:uncharacterized protein
VIIDAHCHIAAEEFIPRSFTCAAVSNIVASLSARNVSESADRLVGMYQERMRDPYCDSLVVEMDRAGIDKSVLLAADFTYALEDCALTIEEIYARHRNVLLRHPGRFEVFGGMDPRWGRDGVDLFERSLREFGFRGLKVYPPCGFSPSDAQLFPLYELCRQYKVPVLVHIGPTSPVLSFESSYPFMLDQAARQFPEVNFIMAHGAVSFVEECSMLCAHRPNVYMDISAYQSRKSAGMRNIRKLVSAGINHKIIFGTDWPVFRMQGDQKSFVDDLVGEKGALGRLSESECALILHQNIWRLMYGATPPADA